jgi:hypothetical protein
MDFCPFSPKKICITAHFSPLVQREIGAAMLTLLQHYNWPVKVENISKSCSEFVPFFGLLRDKSIASSKLRSPKSAILSLSPDEEFRIFFLRDCPGKVVMW